jgi:hypothetical protein
MNMKQVAGLVFAMVLCATTAVVSAQERKAVTIFEGKAARTVPIEGQIVKGAPFSAEVQTESVQTLADGNRIVQRSSSRVFRDGEGRMRREEDRTSGGPTVSITDPVARTSYTLDPQNHVAWQTPAVAIFLKTAVQDIQALVTRLPPGVAGRGETIQTRDSYSFQYEAGGRGRGAAGVGDEKTEQLPERTIEGVRATGVRRTTTIRAGAIGNELPIEIVSEEWRSPDLKILLLTEHRDPRTGITTYRVFNIVRAEPDASLFVVPSDYKLQPGFPLNKPLKSVVVR